MYFSWGIFLQSSMRLEALPRFDFSSLTDRRFSGYTERVAELAGELKESQMLCHLRGGETGCVVWHGPDRRCVVPLRFGQG
jgi:hypothetical protein